MPTPTTLLEDALRGVETDRLAPYLGAGVAALTAEVPASPQALCALIEAEIRAPKRASGNLWSVAQFVESRRFRATLNDIIERAFAAGVKGNPIHDWVARAKPALAVDVWYDDGLLNAFAGQKDWGWVQGVSRNGEWVEIWHRAYDAAGELVGDDPDAAWKTLLYKPHGLARKGSSFLMSDSDYVEVLTEIDIQSPIPEEVRKRRTGRGFLFLGCRFDDQMLRIFARQIAKRSSGPHYAVLPAELTRMEKKFIEEIGVTPIELPLSAVVDMLAAPA